MNFFLKFLEDIIPSCGATNNRFFFTSGDFYAGIQSQAVFSGLYASSPVCDGSLRFISDATPADLLATSIVAEPFRFTYMKCLSFCYSRWRNWMKFPQYRILTRMITYQTIIKQGIDQNRSTCEQLLEEWVHHWRKVLEISANYGTVHVYQCQT